MTGNQIMFSLVPLLLFVFVFVFAMLWMRKPKDLPPKEHGPHTPGAGYDQKAAARSKLEGLGNNDHSGE